MNRSMHEIQPEEVMAYLDGELSPERAADVARHLEDCVGCQGLAGDLRTVSQEVTVWQVETAPEHLVEGIKAALAKQTVAETAVTEREPSRRFWIPRWTWGLAGGLAVFLIAITVAFPPVPYRRAAAPQMAEYSAVPAQSAAPAAPQAQTDQSMIIRTAALMIITREFETARRTMELTVRRHQGYIAQLHVSEPSGQARTLAATLRVPADRLDAALAELKQLGRLEQESQSGEEVTQQYVDLVARLSNSRNTEQRLIEIMRQRTGRVADILAVEQEIGRVREQIERMEADRKNLENHVGFASVQLQLSEDHRASLEVTPPSTFTRLWNDLVVGIRSVAGSVLSLIAFVLRYGPSLLFWVLILFWPARSLWRRLRPALRTWS